MHSVTAPLPHSSEETEQYQSIKIWLLWKKKDDIKIKDKLTKPPPNKNQKT